MPSELGCWRHKEFMAGRAAEFLNRNEECLGLAFKFGEV